MNDVLMIIAAVVALYFILKIAFKILKFALILGVIGVLLYYLNNSGFLSGII